MDARIAALSYRELQAKCKQLDLPGVGKKEVLQANLNDYLKNPRETLRRLAREAAAKRKKGFVDWKNSPAREILFEDLEPPKGLLYGVDNLDAEHVYDYYLDRHKDIFELVPFEQFKGKYEEAIQRAFKRRARSAEEEEMLKHDRRLHPRQTHNSRGEPVFDMDTEAKVQLKEDIKNGLHERMTPMELWNHRQVYSKYTLSKFRQRIYQYKKTAKFYNWLEKERNLNRDKFAKMMTPKEVIFGKVPNQQVPKVTKIREGRQRKRSRSEKSSNGAGSELKKRNKSSKRQG